MNPKIAGLGHPANIKGTECKNNSAVMRHYVTASFYKIYRLSLRLGASFRTIPHIFVVPKLCQSKM